MNILKTLSLIAFMSFNATSNGNVVSNERSWRFQVFLDDSPIGYHQFSLEQNADKQTLYIKAEFDVKFLFINVYSYRHDNIETWKGACLETLTSNTNDNGEVVFVRINEQADGMNIETPSASTQVNTCLRSFAYWNPELLKTKQLLNAQTGELIDIEFTHTGTESLKLNDKNIQSERYRLQGKDIEIDLWYSARNEWLALQSTTENGSILRYVLHQEESQ